MNILTSLSSSVVWSLTMFDCRNKIAAFTVLVVRIHLLLLVGILLFVLESKRVTHSMSLMPWK